MVLVCGGKDHISYVPYLLITKRGRDVGVAWHGLRGSLFHSWWDLIISTSLLRLGKFVQDSWLFCHHQIGEDCWVYRFDETKQERMEHEGLNVTKDESSMKEKDYSKSFYLFNIFFVTLILCYINRIQGISFYYVFHNVEYRKVCVCVCV